MRSATLVLLGVVALSNVLPAQVGNPPSQSPYRDIPRAAGAVITGGYLLGNEGTLGVGITDAITVGARYDVPLGGALRLGVGFAYGFGERFLLDPTKDSASRKSGPVGDNFLLAEADVQFLVTGHKTWRNIAPYVAAGASLMLGGAEPAADTTYRLGAKLLLAPGAGVRWYPARRLCAQLDARLVLLRLGYPERYYLPGPDGKTILGPLDDQREWTRFPWIRASVGWTF
ncbi:MAG TPA: hypothetical protein VF978_01545 [Gemmatimonadales bacterium]